MSTNTEQRLQQQCDDLMIQLSASQAREAELQRELRIAKAHEAASDEANKTLSKEIAELRNLLEESKVPEFAEFNKWMNKELPSGTIVGDAGWWAARIYKRFMQSQPKEPKQ
jgi:hypothetical protein